MSEFTDDIKVIWNLWRDITCYFLGHKEYYMEWEKCSITSDSSHYRYKKCNRCNRELCIEKGYFNSNRRLEKK